MRMCVCAYGVLTDLLVCHKNVFRDNVGLRSDERDDGAKQLRMEGVQGVYIDSSHTNSPTHARTTSPTHPPTYSPSSTHARTHARTHPLTHSLTMVAPLKFVAGDTTTALLLPPRSSPSNTTTGPPDRPRSAEPGAPAKGPWPRTMVPCHVVKPALSKILSLCDLTMRK